VTNGLLLDGEMAEKLASAPPFTLNVSIDAGTRETYAKVRGRDRFEQAVDNLTEFMKRRNRHHSRTGVEWIYVMMKSNFRELPRAVALARRSGVDKFTAKHLELAATRQFMDEAIWNYPTSPDLAPELAEEMAAIEDECRRIAEGKLILNFHPLIHTDEYWGKSGPVFKMFLSHEGNVTACSLISPNNHRPFSDPGFDRNWILGNVLEKPLEQIIESEVYRDFQNEWLSQTVPPPCRGCPFSLRLGEDGLCHAL
ncbi:MAG: SPASM domain-containing protein, partial [Candidatus Omnitrophica bacterium]|nr:SPASM domain-containing protein [Candidatus Omnitrophota bacterium]